MPKKIRYPVYPFKLDRGGHGLLIRDLAKRLFMSQKKLECAIDEKLLILFEGIFPSARYTFTDSGKSALVVAFRAFGIGESDEVILTTFNCPAVIDAVLTVGATPVLVDINERFVMSLASVKRSVTKRTRAIILTHTYGFSEDDQLVNWARSKGILMIDDAAQALFNNVNNVRCGFAGDVGILSFGSTKPIFSLGGGCVIWKSDRDSVYSSINISTESLDQLTQRYTGYLRERFQLFAMSELPEWSHVLLKKFGILPTLLNDKLDALPDRVDNAEPLLMNQLHKQILANQLKQFKQKEEALALNFKLLKSSIETCCDISVVGDIVEGHGYNYFTLLFKHSGDRYRCAKYLSFKGIQTCWNYYPLHLMPIYARFGKENPNAEKLWKLVLSIPFKPPNTADDLSYIASCVVQSMREVSNESSSVYG